MPGSPPSACPSKVGVWRLTLALDSATSVENIFYTSGSPKQAKELEVTFDCPPRYGKSLDWTGYTVHDAASVVIRYLAQMPESVIPPRFYESFQAPLRGPQSAAVEWLNQPAGVNTYQELIIDLPPLSRQFSTSWVFGQQLHLNQT